MTLHRGTAISAAVATLSAPPGTIGTASANYTYTARANTTLASSTTYYVVLKDSGGNMHVRLTDSNAEDSGGTTAGASRTAPAGGWARKTAPSPIYPNPS